MWSYGKEDHWWGLQCWKLQNLWREGKSKLWQRGKIIYSDAPYARKLFASRWAIYFEMNVITLLYYHFRSYHLFFLLKSKAPASALVISWLLSQQQWLKKSLESFSWQKSSRQRGRFDCDQQKEDTLGLATSLETLRLLTSHSDKQCSNPRRWRSPFRNMVTSCHLDASS